MNTPKLPPLPNWLPTAENINALPELIRLYIADLETNADPAGTVRDLAIARDTIRALEASNRMLRDAAITAQGVPDGWQLVPKQPTDEMQAHAMSYVYVKGFTRGTGPAAVYAAMLASAPPAPQAAVVQQEPVLTTCNCRWDGEKQVQQCTLHEAHIDAIHEWAERAKTAEAKLSAQQAKPQPLSDELHQDIASVRAAEQWMFLTGLPIPSDIYAALAQAVDNLERHYGIKE